MSKCVEIEDVAFYKPNYDDFVPDLAEFAHRQNVNFPHFYDHDYGNEKTGNSSQKPDSRYEKHNSDLPSDGLVEPDVRWKLDWEDLVPSLEDVHLCRLEPDLLDRFLTGGLDGSDISAAVEIVNENPKVAAVHRLEPDLLDRFLTGGLDGSGISAAVEIVNENPKVAAIHRQEPQWGALVADDEAFHVVPELASADRSWHGGEESREENGVPQESSRFIDSDTEELIGSGCLAALDQYVPNYVPEE